MIRRLRTASRRTAAALLLKEVDNVNATTRTNLIAAALVGARAFTATITHNEQIPKQDEHSKNQYGE